MDTPKHKTLIKRREVLQRTALANSSLYRLMESGDFPQSLQIGPRAVAWVESEVEQWIEKKIKEAHAKRDGK
jgi:prophage regulatory protein